MSFVNLVNCCCCTVHNKNIMVVIWSSPIQILGKLVYKVHDQALNSNKQIDRQTEYSEIPPKLGSIDCVSMFFLWDNPLFLIISKMYSFEEVSLNKMKIKNVTHNRLNFQT